MGTLMRANDIGATLDGPEGITFVRDKLNQFDAELGNIAHIFDLAYQTEDPGDLSENVRNTLKEFGFVVEYLAEDNKTAKYQYHVVNATQGLGDFIDRKKRGMNIPGSTLWNVITPKSVGITIASSYLPGLGARWITTGLEAVGTSKAGVILGKFLVEATISAGQSVVQEATEHYLKDKSFTVNFEKILLESYGLGAIQEVAGLAGEKILENMVREASRSANQQATREFLKKALLEDPSGARKIYDFVNNSTAILVDTSVGFAFQPMIDGQPLDIATFQSMLMQAAVARAVNSATKNIGDALRRKGAPEVLIKAIEQNPELAAEIQVVVNKRAEADSALKERFLKSVDETGFSAAAHFESMLTGEFDFVATKALLKSKLISDAQMDEVAVHRWGLINDNVEKGRFVGIEEVNRNLQNFYEHELTRHNDPVRAREEAMKRVKWELDLISQDPIIPGARTKISDVDRSAASVS